MKSFVVVEVVVQTVILVFFSGDKCILTPTVSIRTAMKNTPDNATCSGARSDAYTGKARSDLISWPEQLIFISSYPQPGFLLCWGQKRNMEISVLLPLTCNTCPEDTAHLGVQISQFWLVQNG